MKICVAQIRTSKGAIQNNISTHENLIDLAVTYKAELIMFPELSITGYEPELASSRATHLDDKLFDIFQQKSDSNKITICAGMPLKTESGILISMLIFQSGKERQVYSKQYLHQDEQPYFVCGQQQLYITVNSYKIALGICYESLLPDHSKKAFQDGADMYIASVAKSAKGVEKALKHFSTTALQYSKTILMSNCVGPCDNFESAGQSSIWNNKGILLAQLDNTHEGVIIYDTVTEEVVSETL